MFFNVITRDRFLLILQFLHCNNNNDPNCNLRDENRDQLHKIQPFLDVSRERFRKVYQPGKQLSVEKSLILSKGRLHFNLLK